MPTAPQKACSGCGKACDRETMRDGRCIDCAKPIDAAYEKYRNSDPIRKIYNSSRWQKFRRYMLGCNPICQRIVTNVLTFQQEQCPAPAVEVHHLVSPRTRIDLFTTPSNVVCLCKHCHGKTPGEPDGKRDPALYVPTLAGFGATGGIKPVN
jgi:5-methylcytosine-specific restriction enzyme A